MALASAKATTDCAGIDREYFALALGVELLEQLLESLSDFYFVGALEHFERVLSFFHQDGGFFGNQRTDDYLALTFIHYSASFLERAFLAGASSVDFSAFFAGAFLGASDFSFAGAFSAVLAGAFAAFALAGAFSAAALAL